MIVFKTFINYGSTDQALDDVFVYPDTYIVECVEGNIEIYNPDIEVPITSVKDDYKSSLADGFELWVDGLLVLVHYK